MNPKARIALLTVAALAALAALVWLLQRPPQSAPSSASTPEAASTPGVQPALPPEAPTPATLPGPSSPSAVPEAPTLTGAPVQDAPAGGGFVVHSDADGPKVIDLAIEAAGGRAALEPLRRSTWRYFASGGSAVRGGVMLFDGHRAALVADVDGGGEIGIAGDTCWVKRDEVVAPCDILEDGYVRNLRLLHAVTVLLPLTEPPFQLEGASMALSGGQLTNVLRYSFGDPQRELVVALDPNKHHVLRLEVSAKVGCCSIKVDLDDRRGLAGAMVPTLRRITTPLTPDKAGQQAIERLDAPEPGVDAARLKPPKPTGNQPLRVKTRPAMTVVEVKAASHAQFGDAATELSRLLAAPDEELTARLYEALGPLDRPEDGVAAWAAVRNVHALTAPGLRSRLVTVPAEPALAAQVMRLSIGEIPQAFKAFVDAAKAGGHAPGTGRAAVRFFGSPDPKTGEVTVELQLPLRPR